MKRIVQIPWEGISPCGCGKDPLPGDPLKLVLRKDKFANPDDVRIVLETTFIETLPGRDPYRYFRLEYEDTAVLKSELPFVLNFCHVEDVRCVECCDGVLQQVAIDTCPLDPNKAPESYGEFYDNTKPNLRYALGPNGVVIEAWNPDAGVWVPAVGSCDNYYGLEPFKEE